MIECPACKISFGPSHRVCPRCQTFEPALNDRIEYLISAAEMELENGVVSSEVEARLVQDGVSPNEAHEIVFQRVAKMRAATRIYGYKRLAGGVGMLFLATFPFAAAILGEARRVRFIVLGLILGGMGVRLLILGSRNVLFGRE